MTYAFATGMYRSGTTLLAKILDSHPEIIFHDQPSTKLFIEIKKKFLNNKGIETELVLSHLFCEERYSKDTFLQFLKSSPKHISFIETFRKFNKEISQDLLSAEKVIGSKEIIAEEFIPYLLENNTKVILIIRDIRDVITSLNHGTGHKYMGETRPTLFHIRNWRKSIAYALEYASKENLLIIKYEDLVSSPNKLLQKVTNFLYVSDFSLQDINKNLFGKNVKKWTPNSSFSRKKQISSDSIGRYKKILTRDTIKFIESFCFPELKAFDYELEYRPSLDTTAYKEPYNVTHRLFINGNEKSEPGIDAEIERCEMLANPGKYSTEDIFRFFLFKKAFNLYTER